MIETAGPPVLWIEAGENITPGAFTLNGWNEVEDILLEVVAGPEMIHCVGSQEVVVPEE